VNSSNSSGKGGTAVGTEPSEQQNRFLRYLEVVTGSLEEKRRYRTCKKRIERLPHDYRMAVEALQRYMQHFGPDQSASLVAMLEDLTHLFEQSAADGTPLRDVVGEDPVDFAEAFLRNYPGGSWIRRERDRLTKVIDGVTGGMP
jgi:DNA-binding ferritin-like protein (Dps family)